MLQIFFSPDVSYFLPCPTRVLVHMGDIIDSLSTGCFIHCQQGNSSPCLPAAWHEHEVLAKRENKKETVRGEGIADREVSLR